MKKSSKESVEKFGWKVVHWFEAEEISAAVFFNGKIVNLNYPDYEPVVTQGDVRTYCKEAYDDALVSIISEGYITNYYVDKGVLPTRLRKLGWQNNCIWTKIYTWCWQAHELDLPEERIDNFFHEV